MAENTIFQRTDKLEKNKEFNLHFLVFIGFVYRQHMDEDLEDLSAQVSSATASWYGSEFAAQQVRIGLMLFLNHNGKVRRVSPVKLEFLKVKIEKFIKC
jgi:hypothetical protein